MAGHVLGRLAQELAVDVTLAELGIEAFLPADAATAEVVAAPAADGP